MAAKAMAAVIITVISFSFSIVITAAKTQFFNEDCFLLPVYLSLIDYAQARRRRPRQTICQPLPRRSPCKQRTPQSTPQDQPRYLASLQPLASLPTRPRHTIGRITATATIHSHYLNTSWFYCIATSTLRRVTVRRLFVPAAQVKRRPTNERRLP